MMIRIANINMPGHLNVFSAMLKIKGIGPTKAKKLCLDLSIPYTTRIETLAQENIDAISNYIFENFMVEDTLKRSVAEHIQRLKLIGCRRGMRITRGLPTRGQRTHTNAKSARKNKGL